jgi:TRAP-type C4-dicarboxylate transport system permease small subunit
LNKVLVALAGTVLVIMTFLACVNVMFRSGGIPVKGTFELMGFFGALIASFALGRTQMAREHISVDCLINLFPARLQRVCSGINYAVGITFFALAGWETARWGTTLWRVHELSETLRIVYFPFVYCVSLGCFVIALVLLVDMLNLLNGTQEVRS